MTFVFLLTAHRFMQEFLVAVGVRGATLQHRVVPPSLGWYDQVGQDGATTTTTTYIQRALEGNIMQ